MGSPMLHSIVENEQGCLGTLGQGGGGAAAAVGIGDDRHIQLGKERPLVADSMRSGFISAQQDRRALPGGDEAAAEPLNDWGFAGSAGGEIADAEGRLAERV